MKTFFTILFILVLAVPVFPNPPQDITLKISDQGIEIFVVHPSSAPTQHFIKEIKVYHNGLEAVNRVFAEQKPEGQKTFFEVTGLMKGDKIKIYAACSQYGDLEKGFPVP
jgi:hypothetical protein